MEENKTSVLSNGLIWFGAGVSMSEILTGTYFAPLGMKPAIFYFKYFTACRLACDFKL